MMTSGLLRAMCNYRSSHTRLRQLADFPSLIVRSSFGVFNIPPAPFKGGDVMVNIHEKLLILNYPLRILHQLADFLQRGRCDGLYTRKTFQTVSI